MNEKKMTRVHLTFPTEMLDRLRKLADETGAPLSELVRRAVEASLVRSGRPKAMQGG